jgi:hypothetical protein
MYAAKSDGAFVHWFNTFVVYARQVRASVQSIQSFKWQNTHQGVGGTVYRLSVYLSIQINYRLYVQNYMV